MARTSSSSSSSSYLGSGLFLFITTIIVMLLVSNIKADLDYPFYKTVVLWPTSFCKARNTRCQKPYKRWFVVHGVWPMQSDNVPVPPYEKSNCTETPPVQGFRITRGTFFGILPQMHKYWSDVRFYHNNSADLELWRRQWMRHGRCFGYPQEPLSYFQTGLIVPTTRDLVDVLEEAGIKPNDTHGYEASRIHQTISIYATDNVEIFCNKDKDGNLQLLEVGVCFERDGIVRECPETLNNCQGEIRFPVPLIRGIRT